MLIGAPYDPKVADIWSSGIVLFTMTCGFLPFYDVDVVSLYKKISK
jgi:5'-AMP-activated protein kinase catalytic alpha subunit